MMMMMMMMVLLQDPVDFRRNESLTRGTSLTAVFVVYKTVNHWCRVMNWK
jgi:hypothetical protein